MKNQATNYKQTKIDEIPSDWEVGNLGSVALFQNGKSSPERDSHSKYPVYGANGIIGYANQPNANAGTVVVGRVGAYCGSLYYSQNPCWVTDNAIKGTVKSDFNSKYLYYLLRTLELNSRSGGSGQPLLNQKILNAIEVTFPLLAEQQQQIVSVLSSLDDKIELNRRMNKTLEEIGKALFKYWFVDSETLGAKVELESFIELNPRENLKKGEIARYVEMKDLPEQGMWVSSQVSKPYKGGSKFRNSDSLMARITPCLENGKSALVNFLEDGELAFGSTEYIVFRPKEKHYREYVYYLVRNERFRRHAIKSMVGSSGRQRVQIDAIRNYKLKQPSEDLVEKFHNLMEPVFQRIKTNALENEILSLLRDSLLPRLMSGRLRVSS